MTMHPQHLSQIEERVEAFRRELAALASEKELREFLALIRKPGWTTPAELAFVVGILDSMIAHTKVQTGLKRALISAGEAVSLNPQPLPPRE